MKKKRRIENRIIAVILCMAILFSQVNIADAADVNPSGTNTSQVALSDDANKSNGEVSTESTVSDEINGTTESEDVYKRQSGVSEVPISKGDSVSSAPGKLSLITKMTDSYTTTRGDEKNCSYEYKMDLKVRTGKFEDYNLSLIHI